MGHRAFDLAGIEPSALKLQVCPTLYRHVRVRPDAPLPKPIPLQGRLAAALFASYHPLALKIACKNAARSAGFIGRGRE